MAPSITTATTRDAASIQCHSPLLTDVGASASDAFQNLSLHDTHASLVPQPLSMVTTMEDPIESRR